MPGRLDRTDRWLLIGAGAVVILLVIAAAILGPAQVTGEGVLPSSYSPAWDGTEAAYLLLQNLGYRVDRWEKPAADLQPPDGHAVWILADPATPPNEDDLNGIRRFLEAGGCVLATGSSAAGFLPGGSQFTEGSPWDHWREFPPLIPSPLTRGIRGITLSPPADWHPNVSQTTVFGDEDTAAVLTWKFGSGRIIWWAAATPLTNGGIRQSGNLALLLNSVGPVAGTSVLWDEYYHGARATLWSFLAPTPAPWILAQIGLVLFALAFTYSRRLGPSRMPAEASRLSPLEFVDTLGDLYYSARAGSSAVATATGRLRFLLARQLGVSIDASSIEISRSASQQLDWNAEVLASTLDRADQAARNPGTGNEEALKLVREIHEWITRLQIGSSGNRKETP